jgi:hypothetical protein
VRRSAILAIVLSACVDQAPRSVDHPPRATGRISGRVTAIDGSAGVPLSRIEVAVVLGETTIASATTNDGDYAIDAVPVGTYRLLFCYRGILLRERSVTLDDSRTTPVFVGFPLDRFHALVRYGAPCTGAAPLQRTTFI